MHWLIHFLVFSTLYSGVTIASDVIVPHFQKPTPWLNTIGNTSELCMQVLTRLRAGRIPSVSDYDWLGNKPDPFRWRVAILRGTFPALPDKGKLLAVTDWEILIRQIIPYYGSSIGGRYFIRSPQNQGATLMEAVKNGPYEMSLLESSWKTNDPHEVYSVRIMDGRGVPIVSSQIVQGLRMHVRLNPKNFEGGIQFLIEKAGGRGKIVQYNHTHPYPAFSEFKSIGNDTKRLRHPGAHILNKADIEFGKEVSNLFPNMKLEVRATAFEATYSAFFHRGKLLQ